MSSSLDAFFHPRAVAVVGASHDPSKVGGSVLANLRAGGFTGRIVAVNSARAHVQGLAARRSVLEIEEPIDLAVVAVPAACVQAVLEQCVARGIPGAIVISAGFRVSGFIVQRMAPDDGFQLLLGMVRDPQFGPLVVLGFGGIYVEVLKDTTTRLAPVDRADALLMIRELRMAPALEGARGVPPADLDALADTISRFSWLATTADELAEIEINPLAAGAAGARALDVRAIRRERQTPCNA